MPHARRSAPLDRVSLGVGCRYPGQSVLRDDTDRVDYRVAEKLRAFWTVKAKTKLPVGERNSMKGLNVCAFIVLALAATLADAVNAADYP